MDIYEQLAFWPTMEQQRDTDPDDWPSSPTFGKSGYVSGDEITVSNEWRTDFHNAYVFIIHPVGAGTPAVRLTVAEAAVISLLSRSVGGGNEVPHLADASAPVLKITPRSTSSSLMISNHRRDVMELVPKRTSHFEIAHAVLRRKSAATDAMASAIKRISQEVARHELDQAWTRVWSRTLDQPVSAPSTTELVPKSDQFVPSPALIEKVREGFRSHSENYSRLVEPRFISKGIELLRDEDVSKFIATRIWRLILSLADRAAIKGKDELQLGNNDGFLDQLDHLILDRIPVSPKDVTPFLKTLYEEYRQFAADTRVLPGRGTLWSGRDGLFCRIDNVDLINSTELDEASTQQTEVLYE